MKVNIGDKVRFLNEVGGGEVTKIIDSEKIAVLGEDGFEMPVMVYDVVVVEKGEKKPDTGGFHTAVSEKKKPKIQPEKQKARNADSNHVFLSLLLAPDAKEITLAKKFHLYLVNDSLYNVDFLYFSGAASELHFQEKDVLEPNTKLILDTIEAEDIGFLSRIGIQAVFSKEESFEMKPAVSEIIETHPKKFFQAGNYKENDFLDDKAFELFIFTDDPNRQPKMELSREEIMEALKQKEEQGSAQPLAKKHPKNEKGNLIEVDLHIHELLDNTNGLSNNEMLEYQMDKFHAVMKENLNKKGQRIVFIHGKGNGVLKQKILQELKYAYKQVNYQDASFREYGFGATMVMV